MPKKRAKAKPLAGRPVSENEIHLKCFQWVQKTYPTLLIFHVANESNVPVQYRVKMKRKGVLAGVADFLMFPLDGRKFAIELKERKGKQRLEQINFQKRWEVTGGVYVVLRTVKDFQSFVCVVMLFASLPKQ